MAGSPFKIDWTDFKAVCDYCDLLNASAMPGFESVVVRIQDRSNYNITHAERAVRDDLIILHPRG